jgi:hypothetical protein
MGDLPARVTALAVTPIKDQCFFDDCDRPTVGAAAYHSSAHRDVVIVWLCEEHGAAFTAPPDATTGVLVQETSRTCRETTDNRICGAYATHVRVIGGEYDDERRREIRIVSVCERHAQAS